jgi:SAM-dependent methyltransferase
MTKISYHHVREFPGWAKAPDLLLQLIGEYEPKILLEIGSGANPTLDAETARRFGLHYITSDSNEAELDKAPPGLEARLLDLDSEQLPDDLLSRCDIVFSRMVNEHVTDAERYHNNILQLLAPGGIAVHCFSTLYAFPFVVNALVSGAASEWLLDFATRRRHHSKFPARYSWSRGPTASMLRRFEKMGYEVMSYKGYFGHWYYSRVKPLQDLEFWKASALLAFPNPFLCSYAMVTLRRPDGVGATQTGTAREQLVRCNQQEEKVTRKVVVIRGGPSGAP